MQDWTPQIEPGSGPKYLAIAEALSNDIAAGRVRRGARLPSQRLLAARLGFDLTTVTRAYREAQRQGLIEGDGRRGSFVRKSPPQPVSSDLSAGRSGGMNTPPEGVAGKLSSEFIRAAENVLARDCGAPFHYQVSTGMARARQAGEEILRSRSIPFGNENLLVTAGGQHALHAIFSAELKRGDVLAVGRYVYPGILSLARRFGIQLCVVDGDDEGMLPEALDAACQRSAVRAVYLVPSNDNPTTVTMGAARREALAGVVTSHKVSIIEDDAYGLLATRPATPFAALVPDLTWHIASVSKLITPGLRVAWMRVPNAASAWRLGADLHETTIMASPLNAAVVAEWVDTGVFFDLIDDVRNEARSRQAIARSCLPQASFAAHEDGYHLWLELGDDAIPSQISDALRQQGVSATAGEAFAADRSQNHRALRVSIGGSMSQDQLRRGLSVLAAVLQPDVTRKSLLV